MSSRSPLIAASVAALSLLASAATASAACKTMGFTVNDYGKDGPTQDAKDLLDKDIAKWAADNGVEKYTVGKKNVKCELFLDVILFDEHTCTASASVCWGEGSTPPAKTAKDGSTPPAKDGSTPQKKSEAKAAAHSEAKPPVETGTIPPDAATTKTEAPAVADTPAEKPVEAAVTPPPAATAPAASQADAAERAAAAAERAAAAAERAAAAAEKAAAGHKSAAADDGPPIDAARQIAPAGTSPKP